MLTKAVTAVLVISKAMMRAIMAIAHFILLASLWILLDIRAILSLKLAFSKFLQPTPIALYSMIYDRVSDFLRQSVLPGAIVPVIGVKLTLSPDF